MMREFENLKSLTGKVAEWAEDGAEKTCEPESVFKEIVGQKKDRGKEQPQGHQPSGYQGANVVFKLNEREKGEEPVKQ